jgi:hypothetical protein
MVHFLQHNSYKTRSLHKEANFISPRPWPLEETSSTREPQHVIIVGTKTQECKAMNKENIRKSLDKVGHDHHLVKAPIPLSLLVLSS